MAGEGDGELVSALLSGTSELKITVSELVLAPPTEREDADRCTNWPLTPLAALKKFAEQR